MIAHMTNIDRALLLSEWMNVSTHRECPCCDAMRPDGHQPGCVMDLALAERGYATQFDRDRARGVLNTASVPTLPPALPDGR
jgi:hypothetical protein